MACKFGKWLLPILTATGVSAAAPAGLDETFGDQGVSILDLVSGLGLTESMSAYASATTQDGGVVVVGTRGDRELELVKLTDRGLLDTSFGEEGRVTIPGIRVWPEGGICLAVQPDGKVVFGLWLYFDPAGEFILVRVNPDGTFDPTFGSGGLAFPPFPDRFFARKLIILPDGRMLLGATSSAGLRIARLLPDGTLDGSFGTGGYARGTVPIWNNHSGQVPDMRLQPDGKILINSISRFTSGSASSWWSVTRFHPDGAIDFDFGSSGYVHMSAAGSNGHLSDFALLQSGEILVPGIGTSPARLYAPSGSTHASISGTVGWRMACLANGKVVSLANLSTLRSFDPQTGLSQGLPASGGLVQQTVTPEPTGGFLVTGWGFGWQKPKMEVARYRADGSLVTTFGTGGLVSQWLKSLQTFSAVQLSHLADGRVAVCYSPGLTGDLASHQNAGRILLDADGTPESPQSLVDGASALDLTKTGELLFPAGNSLTRVRLDGTASPAPQPAIPAGFQIACMEELSTGEIIAGGGDEVVVGFTEAAVRLLAAGRAPKLLKIKGYLNVTALVRDRKGGWIATLEDWSEQRTLCHILPSFTLDTKFGVRGLLKLAPGAPLPGRQSVGVLGDGRIAVALGQNDGSVGLGLHSAQGRPLDTLQADGLVEGQTHLFAGADGRLVFAGSTEDGFAIHRVTGNDIIDPRWGGEVTNGYGRPDTVWELTRSATGEWWVGGDTSRAASSHPFVAKFKPEPVTVSLLNPDAPVQYDRSTRLYTHTVRLDNHTDEVKPFAALRIAGLPLATFVRGGASGGAPGALLLPVPAIPARGSIQVVIHYHLLTRTTLVFQPTLEVVDRTDRVDRGPVLHPTRSR